MRLRLLVVLAFLIPTGVSAQSIDPDDFLNSLNRYLSKRWGLIPLGISGDQEYVRVGGVYSYSEPDDYCRLLRLAGGTRQVDLSPFDTEPLPGLPSTTLSEVETYTIKEKLSTHLAGDLEAKIKQAGGSVSGFKDRLRKASISFTVTRHFIPAKPLIRAVGNYDAGSLDPSMKGLVAVAQVLVLSDFRFSSTAIKQGNGSLGLGFLDMVRGKLTRSSDEESISGYSFPAKTVVAFRPIVVLPKQNAVCK
jgi:hypothetical protein